MDRAGEMACFVAERAEKMVTDCLLRARESLLRFKNFESVRLPKFFL